MVEKSKMEDQQVQEVVKNYVGEANVYAAFDTLDHAGDG